MEQKDIETGSVDQGKEGNLSRDIIPDIHDEVRDANADSSHGYVAGWQLAIIMVSTTFVSLLVLLDSTIIGNVSAYTQAKRIFILINIVAHMVRQSPASLMNFILSQTPDGTEQCTSLQSEYQIVPKANITVGQFLMR